MNLHQFRFVQEAARRNLNLTEADARRLGADDIVISTEAAQMAAAHLAAKK